MCLSLRGIAASVGSPADEGLPQSGFYSLKVDVARKTASQQINQRFSPKYQSAPGWEKTLLMDGFIMGIAVSWKVIKTDTLLTG